MTSTGSILYGGDEIGAIVFDLGHHSMRVGYAQDETPKVDIPSDVGIRTELKRSKNSDVANGLVEVDEEGNPVNSVTHRYIDTNAVCLSRSGLKMVNYMKDGMIEDWDIFENVVEYAYHNHIHSDRRLHPVLISEPPWNEKHKREKLAELMFEKFNVPAFFVVKNAVLAAFASGRTTALVVDSGATHTSAVPVQDGYVLKRSVVKTPLGGDYITNKCKVFLQENNIDVVPTYQVASKQAVGKNQEACWVRKTNLPDVTDSWHNYMVTKVIQDFQSTVLQFTEQPFSEKDEYPNPPVHYEFPNGYHQDFGKEVHSIPESLFYPSSEQTAVEQNPVCGIGQIVANSVAKCDLDLRNALFNSIVLTGGNSLIQGFTERLYRDLPVRIPSGVRVKILAANGSAERRFGSWIGGSIISSIGTFQQLWISSQEYEEIGKGQVDAKCP